MLSTPIPKSSCISLEFRHTSLAIIKEVYFIGPVRQAHKPEISVTFIFASSLYMPPNYTEVGHMKYRCERLLCEYTAAINVEKLYHFKK